MLTALFLRNQEAHIVSFRLSNGNYRTICGKVTQKKDRVNTLAADNTFPGTCSVCKNFYDEMYQADLNASPNEARSQTVTNMKTKFSWHEYHLIGDSHKYANMDHKFWPKLHKLSKLIPEPGKRKK